MGKSTGSSPKKVRYCVVGLGYIAQTAVLPAFKHAGENSELTALVSGDSLKLKTLSKKYGVRQTFSYSQYETCLKSGEVDAVYIALPNNLHAEFALRSAAAGVHVLCEKPMAVTTKECRRMIEAARRYRIKLMVAYRLHLEKANLFAIETARSGKLGDLRYFHGTLSMSVKTGDIRLKKALGGGTLYDVGIYSINAARYLFRDDPEEVWAASVMGTGPRFKEVDELTAAVLRFPQERLATLFSSFNTQPCHAYELFGTKGRLKLEPAFSYKDPITATLNIQEKVSQKVFPVRDQFAAELVYFSDCILKNKEPEPNGEEGLVDVAIIQALYRSAQSGRPIKLSLEDHSGWPKPELFHASPPRKAA